jgi:hypothetical protein
MDKEYMCREGNWIEGEQETGDVTLRTNMIAKLQGGKSTDILDIQS